MTKRRRNFKLYLDQQPNDVEGWHLLAMALTWGKYPAEAALALETALDFKPHDAQLTYELELCYDNQGKEDARIKLHTALIEYQQDQEAHLRAWLETDPNNSSYWFELGRACLLQEQYAEALNAFQQTTILNPTDGEAWKFLGSTFLKMQRYAEAITTYQHLLTFDDQDGKVWLNLAKAFEHNQQLEEAINAYQHVIALQPDDANILVNLGYAYFQLQRFADAEAIFLQAVAINPNLYQCYWHLGKIYIALEQWDQAEDVLNRYLEFNSDNKAVMQLLKEVQNTNESNFFN